MTGSFACDRLTLLIVGHISPEMNVAPAGVDRLATKGAKLEAAEIPKNHRA